MHHVAVRAEREASERAWTAYRRLAAQREYELPPSLNLPSLVGADFDDAWARFREKSSSDTGKRLRDGAVGFSDETEFRRAWAWCVHSHESLLF